MDNVTVSGVLQGFAPLFYLVPPSKSSFETPKDVPNYVQQVSRTLIGSHRVLTRPTPPLQATPYFFLLIVLEGVVRAPQKKPLPRVNDSISSLTAGMLMTFVPMLTGTVEMAMYSYIYHRCRLADLPWDSSWTWWCAFIAVDFFYYWFHRMAHGTSPGHAPADGRIPFPHLMFPLICSPHPSYVPLTPHMFPSPLICSLTCSPHPSHVPLTPNMFPSPLTCSPHP